MHGMEGGTTGPDDDIAAEYFQNVGATIMGRHMFGGGPPACAFASGWSSSTGGEVLIPPL